MFRLGVFNNKQEAFQVEDLLPTISLLHYHRFVLVSRVFSKTDLG
jgi:hypothetical protein